jgi:AcrR family transcriptional regulator
MGPPDLDGAKIVPRPLDTVKIAGEAGPVAARAGRGQKGGGYHHGDLRAVLLAAATELAAERPLEELSLREVARRAGVSHAAPYHHFAGKAELLAAVARAGFEALDAALAAAQRRAGADPFDQLRAVARAYVRFAAARPNTFRAMFRASSRAQDLEEGGPGPLNRGVDLARACLRRAGRPELDPFPVALVCWSALHGLALLWLDGPLKPAPGVPRRLEPLVEQVTAALVSWIWAGAPSDAR